MMKKNLALFLVFGLSVAGFAADSMKAQNDKYRQDTEQRLKDWSQRIDDLGKQADSATKNKQEQLRTAVRDLQSHQDRIRDELGRISDDRSAAERNRTVENSIDRHFQQMDQLFSANRADGASSTTRTQ